MAELVVSPLIQVVIENVLDGLSGELGQLRGVEKDMRKLQSILSTIKDVLDDAEKRSISEQSVCGWLKKLKDATYDADDVVDMFQTEALRQHVENHDHAIKQVKDLFSSRNPIIFSRKISRKIKDVLEGLDEIALERSKFHLTPGSVSVWSVQRESNSVVIVSEVFGRDDDKENILNFLINEEIDKDLSVLPVVGLGGMGKTTLTQLVYNDERTKHFFDLQIWVCVSDEFNLKEIARKIIECINNQKYRDLELEHLSQLLRKTIGGKRFLLILDDVWNEDHERWEDLKSLLRCCRCGSKIVTTTRSEVVANVMGTRSPHCLKGLSFDDCWNLFRQRAFGLGKEKNTPELTKIGKEIVEKCGGLPLAAKALGSLMGSKRGEHEWLAVRDSAIWKLTDEDKILPALNLSYHHLPSHLKRCFAYCSLFPKDYVFNKKKLIRLWISEGFVASTDEDISVEDVGNQCFNGLLLRSFFQDVDKDIYGDDIVTCKMHDLVHDLACKVGKHEFNLTTYGTEIANCDKYRYLSLIMDDKSPQVLDLNCETKKLRSLNLIQDEWSFYIIKEVNSDVFVKLRNLRVVSLGGCDISILPSTLCRLKHLRFLDLSHSSIKILPTSIGCLYNLSTLILSSCEELEKLPSTITRLHSLHMLDVSYCSQLTELPCDISKMKNLRHLDNHRCNRLSQMPTGMGQLTNLRTLSLFIVGEEEGHHITELQQLNQIRDRLRIKNLQKVTNPMEAREANLMAKTHVKLLQLEWADRREEANVSEEEVLESLVPSPNLKRLELSNYLGISYPSWLQSSTNLVYISLYNLKRLECLPPLGQLPYLKHLELYQLPAVRRIGEEFYGEAGGDILPFQSLQELKLVNMYNLEEWVRYCPALTSLVGNENGNGNRAEQQPPQPPLFFTSLHHLNIRLCGALTSLPEWGGGLTSLQTLEIMGCPKLEMLPESMGGLTSLETLKISYCSKLEKLPESMGGLTSLQTLEIRCSKLEMLPESMGGLTSLRTLKIRCPKLEMLPESMGGLNSLQTLEIIGFPKLEMLPESMGGLTSLQTLRIRECHKLEMLPDGLQCLRTLQQLTIHGCPILERRCKRETGEDWHKIAHNPNIQIIPSSQPEEQQQQQQQQQQETENNSTIRRRGRGGDIKCIPIPSCLRRGENGPSVPSDPK